MKDIPSIHSAILMAVGGAVLDLADQHEAGNDGLHEIDTEIELSVDAELSPAGELYIERAIPRCLGTAVQGLKINSPVYLAIGEALRALGDSQGDMEDYMESMADIIEAYDLSHEDNDFCAGRVEGVVTTLIATQNEVKAEAN